MHEYGVALEIAEIALKNSGGRNIIKINIGNGDLSGVNSESLAMYCDLVFREKQNGAVAVAVEMVPALFKCACGALYAPRKMFDPCPSCKKFDRVVAGGDRCALESIEVEDE